MSKDVEYNDGKITDLEREVLKVVQAAAANPALLPLLKTRLSADGKPVLPESAQLRTSVAVAEANDALALLYRSLLREILAVRTETLLSLSPLENPNRY